MALLSVDKNFSFVEKVQGHCTLFQSLFVVSGEIKT